MLTEKFVMAQIKGLIMQYEGIQTVEVIRSLLHPFELLVILKGKVDGESWGQEFTLGVYDSEYHFLEDVAYFIDGAGIFPRKKDEIHG